MKRIGNKPSFAMNSIMIISLITVWLLFAPSKIGGQASYVMVNGNSMEPRFHLGDLVILKTASQYQMGDIVTYKDASMGAYVIHRIIKVRQDDFVLKGDNNSWIDEYHPNSDEIIGKLWIHIPKLGKFVQWLRMPANMALMISAFGGILMIGTKLQQEQHRRRKSKSSTVSLGWFETMLYALGFLVLFFLSLTIFAFYKPAVRSADDIKYEQTGIYYYSAAGPTGIYDTEILRSGDPIFQKLTCGINVGYSYSINGGVQAVSGTQQLNARISDEQSGWQRIIPLKAETNFSGDSYSVIAPVDLCQIQTLVSAVEEETGFRPSTYTLTIISQIAITAKVNGQDMYDSFTSNLVFQFDKVHFYLAGKNGETDPLQSSKSGKFISSNTQANVVNFLGLGLNILGLRVMGLGGVGLSLLCLLILGWYFFQAVQRDPHVLIHVKYSSLLMDVYEHDFINIHPVIEASSIEDLAKLAERQNTMIMHAAHDWGHSYFVQSDGTTYYYTGNESRQTRNTKKTEVQ